MEKIKNKTINNIAWLLIDKLLIIVLQFFVGVKIANHFGREEYGVYSYAISIITFAPIILEIINDRIIKKYFETEKIESVISTVCYFKFISSVVIIIITILSKFYIPMQDSQLYYLLILLSVDNLLMNYIHGIKVYYEYKLDSKEIVKIDSQIRIGYYFLQYVLIVLNQSLENIIVARILGSFIRSFVIIYKVKKDYSIIFNLKCNINILKKIAFESKYLWLSVISYLLYAQLDKIMIGNMISIDEVGVYAIAFQLMRFMLVPLEAIRVSCYKTLRESFNNDYTEYIKKYKYITFILTQSYLVLSILSYIILPKVFLYVYKLEYIGAVKIFNALLLGIFIRGMETLQYTHYTFKNITKILLYKQCFGLIINVILNFILIKKYGAVGAALATSITLVFTRVIFDIFFKSTREIFFIQLESLNSFRYLIKK